MVDDNIHAFINAKWDNERVEIFTDVMGHIIRKGSLEGIFNTNYLKHQFVVSRIHPIFMNT